MSLTVWAFNVVWTKFEGLLRRWVHVQGVAQQARTLRALAGPDAELPEAAAILHDVGYEPGLIRTGFHPLVGATYLAGIGALPQLAHLVAHHSCAWLEAQLRDLGDEMARYTDERGPACDALWCCDRTTSPGGEAVTAQSQAAKIKQRSVSAGA